MIETACPDDQTLEDVLLGRLSYAELNSWEEHLLGCSRCVQRAEELDSLDHVLRALKLPSHVEIDDDQMEDLRRRGMQVFEETRGQLADETAEFSGDTAASDQPAGSSTASREWSFLEPARDDTEMGRLGGYRILRLLGQGGMGMVFLAEEEALSRPVALKVMSPNLAGDESARQRFLREARAMAAVVNDHIVPIHQVGEHAQIPFLAMPLLEGESLNDRLKRERRLTIDQVCRLGMETATGLAAAKRRGLIHRDIKPDNIWLEAPSGRVKILDFGLARGEEDAELTHSGTVMGTPRYMSPEQAEGQPVDHRSDLFSLGSVLYHAVTGRAPFRGPSLASTLVAVVRAEPKPISEHRQSTPSPLSDLIMRLLAKDPEDRPHSAEEVAESFAAIGHQLESPQVESSGRDTQTPLIPPPLSQARTSKGGRGALGVYAVAAVIAFGFLALLATVVVKWNTPAGIVYLTIDSADVPAEVDIKQDSIDITDPNDGKNIHITVDAANRQMRLEKDGFVAVLTEFNVSSRDGRNIAVKFVPDPPDAVSVSKATQPSDAIVRVVPPSDTARSERTIAEWVIGHGGSVQLQYGDAGWRDESVETIDALPAVDFIISGVALGEVERESDLEILTGLSREVTIWMPRTNITGECLKYFAKIPKLVGLNLQECRNLDPAYVAELSLAPRLESVLLLNSNLGDEVAQLATQVDSLFSVEFGARLTGEGLKALEGCQQLTQISLLGCDLINAEDFEHLQAIPNLNQVSLEPSHLNDDSLAQLAAIPTLRTLRVQDIDDTGLLEVTKLVALSSLVELDLSYTALTFEECQKLQGLHSLQKLGLRGTGLQPSELYRVSNLMPRCEIYSDNGIISSAESRHQKQIDFLTWLVSVGGIADCQDIDSGEYFTVDAASELPEKSVFLGLARVSQAADSDLRRLAGLGEMGGLNLQGSPLSGSGFVHLHPDQNSIVMEGLFLQECSNLEDANLVHLASLSRLIHLYCNETPIGDRLIDLARELPDLQYLGLGSNVSSQGVSQLASHPRIIDLEFSRNSVFTAESLATLQSMPALQRLLIGSDQASADALRVIGGIETLHTLRVHGPLAHARDLVQLRNVTNLELFDFGEQPFDPSALSEMTWLKKLSFNGNDTLTQTVIEELRSALPNCEIHWRE